MGQDGRLMDVCRTASFPYLLYVGSGQIEQKLRRDSGAEPPQGVLLSMTHRTPVCPGASYKAERGHSSMLQMCQAWTHLWGRRWELGGVLLHL